MKRKIITSLASATAAIAFISLTPTAAHADPPPSGCRHGFYSPHQTYAYCTKGVGWVKALAICSNGKATKTVLGDVAPIGRKSVALCSGKYRDAVDHYFVLGR
ncbi:hypothetical protein [Nonomuraea sp. NPDC049309]|uniref:hypothetical protein n=1 Tax=Nonomuraea sp. NPDC049309 TaxID=3364350 RepID=UPI00371EC029